jgi:hypothetical protein
LTPGSPAASDWRITAGDGLEGRLRPQVSWTTAAERSLLIDQHHRDVWSSPLFDTSGFEAWAAAGSQTLEDRLHQAALDFASRCEPVVDDESAAVINGHALRST